MSPTKLTTFEKFDYFMEQTNLSLADLKSDVRDVRDDIADLRNFRMLLIGASVGTSIIATGAFNLVLLWVTYKH